MDFIFSKHSEEQMQRRGLNRETVIPVIMQPDEILSDDKDLTVAIYQSLIKENDQLFLLRVFVNVDKNPNEIVTLYKTSKISKYYEGKIQ
jgi:hypothetical protein